MRDDLLIETKHPLRLTEEQRRALRVLFLAKHARSNGVFDAEDGAHAIYHREIWTILKNLGLEVEAADRFESLFEAPACNYLFTLYNRAGFLNSEAFAPLLAEYRGLAYLGASPVLRALTDDKHLMKVVVRDLGIQTPPWEIYRRGAGPVGDAPFAADRFIVKPNASSASWGLGLFGSWAEVRGHIALLQHQNHDVIVEAFVPGRNVAVPVITNPEPWLLPITETWTDNPDNVPTYEEKREFKEGLRLAPFAQEAWRPQLLSHTRRIVRAIWPFDYGRVEFRIDETDGAIWFIEVNLSCNLSSKKSVVQSAGWLGWSHADVVETILASSLVRQGAVFAKATAADSCRLSA